MNDETNRPSTTLGRALAVFAWLALAAILWVIATPTTLDASTPATALRFTDGTVATGAKGAATQALCSGSTVTGCTVGVDYGGTGATTAAGARDAILWPGAGSIACSSPCTPAAGVVRVTGSGTFTLNLPALSGYADGQTITFLCDSASACTVTGDPSDSGTCDGGSAGAACSAVTVAGHGITAWMRTSSSAWGSVQPGTAVTGVRVHAYVSSGSPLAVLQQKIAGSWVNIGSPVAPDTSQADASATIVPSGSGYSLPAGYGTTSNKPSTGRLDYWKLDGTGNIKNAAGASVTWTPSGPSSIRITYAGSQETASYHQTGFWLGQAGSPSSWGVFGTIGKSAATLSGGCSVNDTAAGPAALTSTGNLQINVFAPGTVAKAYSCYGSVSGGYNDVSGGGTIGASWSTPAFGFFAYRNTLGGGTATVTNTTADFWPPMGELL